MRLGDPLMPFEGKHEKRGREKWEMWLKKKR
jgi:hypothetical protein